MQVACIMVVVVMGMMIMTMMTYCKLLFLSALRNKGIDDWLLTPSQPWRFYQGPRNVEVSQRFIVVP